MFYANTCPIFLNFQKFKFQLRIEPTDEDHYMGINNFSWSAFNNKLKKYNEKNIQEIGSNGKKWVLKIITPKPTALRLLSKIEVTQKYLLVKGCAGLGNRIFSLDALNYW